MYAIRGPFAPDQQRGPAVRFGGGDHLCVEVHEAVPSEQVGPDLRWVLPARHHQVVRVEPATNEQGWAVRTAGRDRWRPVDFDGLILSARNRRG
ncbi:type I-E CRISPR-associated endoribonuclease Cas2 [Streptomyces uncialis]|uniref:type I-E CRISPR-associated endoribonuclease Cas2 n=1 Tax=Streptomyces uncialis TaxID=1048205 RepID=UPI0037A74DC7